MDVPQELRSYLSVEIDQWGVKHIVCTKCKMKFFTLKDAALHLYNIHKVRIAQKLLE
ncbi:hypothetical protein [Pyrobaculum islandicum]|uniref:hypothetical protein n=1 Tax=Pyrobaculum islandicum TaxID=2277 RepID=UPI000ABA036A|nr:hypothetical protein [Pyrobaculum islandicum]